MCRVEAPDVEQFARKHEDLIQVIGVGSQNSFEQAVDFVDDNDTTSFPMIWDQSGQSWAQLGLVGQPAWMVVAPDGKLTSTGGFGAIDEDLAVKVAEIFQAEFSTNQ